jgi:glycosyltransferase involved in cell wall biosynthesis
MKELAGKRILLVIENEAVPFDRRMWNIAQSLRGYGADVTVICPMSGVDNEKFAIIDGIHVYRYRAKFSNGSVFGYFQEYTNAFLKTILLLHKVLVRRWRPHIVHVANPPDIFWPLAPYLKALRIRFIFDEHDLSPETYLSRFGKSEQVGGMLYKVQRLFERLSYRVADVIISTNESYRSKAIAANPMNASKTFVVRNGPDTRIFNVRSPNHSLKNGFRYMAAYIGVMAIQDGVEYIVRATDVLVNQRDFQELIVYLIGTGDDRPRLQQLVREFKLEEYVLFTGRIPDDAALEILSTADVCLSPDPYNPLNDSSTMTKVMEYMALGKPIVSFDLKESRFSAGDAALYVENNDVAAFADGILKLIHDRELSTRMGEIGRKRVDESLSWQKQSGNLLTAYRYVVSL